MTNHETFKIDFIAKGTTLNDWKMILIEEDWTGPLEDSIRQLQTRLYNCIDAILDGQLADRYPETLGKDILIEIEFFRESRPEITDFVKRFAEGVFVDTDYGEALEVSRFANGISFRVNFNKHQETCFD
jgi:hypothetical protein